MRTLESYLAEHAFLEGLEARHRKLIVGCASNVRFDAGKYIFREGEEADRFYLIRDGKVALEIFAPGRGPITVQTLQEGEILGWAWLVPPFQWHFDARAVELTRAIALDGKCLRGKCDEDHQLGYEILKRFSHVMQENLKATRLQVMDVYGVGS
jgi:CRP/FNR family cyclic AMP-dependent transcriptional regulator